jgi:DNA-binding NarL/FixJ family response regulator
MPGIDARRSVDRATAASAERVFQALQLAPARSIAAALQRMARVAQECLTNAFMPWRRARDRAPHPSGLEAIRNVRGRRRMHGEAALVKAAFNAGVSGFVTKSSEPELAYKEWVQNIRMPPSLFASVGA